MPQSVYLLKTKTEALADCLHLSVHTLGTNRVEMPTSYIRALEEIARMASGALGSRDYALTLAVLEMMGRQS